jgi:hypothetical protein
MCNELQLLYTLAYYYVLWIILHRLCVNVDQITDLQKLYTELRNSVLLNSVEICNIIKYLFCITMFSYLFNFITDHIVYLTRSVR